MTRFASLLSRLPSVASLLLLVGGAACVAAGVFLTFGLGVALIVAGVLLVAAEWLVPGRPRSR